MKDLRNSKYMNEIINKINEVISNLKEKIPFKKPGTDSDDDTVLEEGANETPTEDEDEKNFDEMAEEQVEEEQASTNEKNDSNKRNKLIIQIVLGGLVLYLVYDEFFSPPEVEPSLEVSSKKSPVAQTPEPQKPDRPVKPPAPVPVPPPPVPVPPPPAVVKQPVPPSPVKKTSKIPSPGVQPGSPPASLGKIVNVSDKLAEGEKPEKLLGGPPPLKAEETEPGDSGEVLAQVPFQEGKTEKILVDSEKKTALAPSIEPPPKIRKKLEYTSPPDYTQSGRGLVYNCKGQHWACVDKSSYFQCRKNYFWARQENKPPECAIKNVYANDTDCHIVHEHYLNNQQSTDFCEVLEPTL